MPSSFPPARGGVEELTVQLGRHLQRAGRDVLVVTNLLSPDLPVRGLVEGIETARFRFDSPRLAVWPLARFPLSYSSAVAHLLRIRPRPDAIHIQCVSGQSAAAIAFSALTNVPLVVTSQGEVEMDADGIFQRSVYMRTLFRLAARRAACLTACSSWAAESASALAARFADAEVIANGIDPDQWSVSERPIEPIVGAWGRHVREKGFDLLLDAWPRVLAEVPGARLLLGGEGPETRALRECATAEGIEFLGGLDREGVRDLVTRSRIVVVPSRLEPFGIVALEAMACGRPVVWSARGGMSEATGGLGWPVDPTDQRELAAAIVGALRADVLADQLRRHAEDLSWSQITQRYIDVYERVRRATRVSRWPLRRAA